MCTVSQQRQLRPNSAPSRQQTHSRSAGHRTDPKASKCRTYHPPWESPKEAGMFPQHFCAVWNNWFLTPRWVIFNPVEEPGLLQMDFMTLQRMLVFPEQASHSTSLKIQTSGYSSSFRKFYKFARNIFSNCCQKTWIKHRNHLTVFLNSHSHCTWRSLLPKRTWSNNLHPAKLCLLL